jgi:hypothetical protein
MTTGLENVSTYWVVRDEENIIQQNTVFIKQVKWSEVFVAYIYIHFRNGVKKYDEKNTVM